MARVEFDDTELKAGIKRLELTFPKYNKQALNDVANEILRLSSFEVPLDTGNLMNSGSVQEDGDEFIVGYNTRYAARLHENPQYNFQNGRKGKYLEDPIKVNAQILLSFYNETISKLFA